LKTKTFLKNNYFILLIIATVFFSVLMPAPGNFVKANGLTTYLTFIAMFASGLGLSLDNIKDGFRDFKSIFYGFSSMFIVFPAMTFAVLFILGLNSGDIYIGSMIMAAQATTLASAVVLTASANGNVSLALIITLLTNITSAVMTPLILKITLAGQDVSFDAGPMILKLLLVLILPIVLSQVVRKLMPKFVEKTAPFRKMISKFVVVIIVLSGAAAASEAISSNLSLAILIILLVASLHIIMLLISTLYLKISKTKAESRSAVMFASTQKTLPAALLIWESYFAVYTLAPLMLVLNHVVQLIIDSFVVSRLIKKQEKENDR